MDDVRHRIPLKPTRFLDQQPGIGNMIAIPGGSRENVDKMYVKAMSLGYTDECELGKRMPTFYGAYCRDLDGNKICFF